MKTYGTGLAVLGEFAYTVYDSTQNGENLKTALTKGVVSVVASAVDFGEMAKLGDSSIENATKYICSGIFGTAFSSCGTAVNKGISM